MQINAKKILGIGETKDDFKEVVKASFSRAKEHIAAVEEGIAENKAEILEQGKVIAMLKDDICKAKASLNPQKELVLSLEKDINEQKALISSQKTQFELELNSLKIGFSSENDKISTLFGKLDIIIKRLDELEVKIGDIKSSIGNEGVYSNIHSFNIHSFTKQEESVAEDISSELSLEPRKKVEKPDLAILSASRQEILGRFSALSKQELRTFLTIYELEDGKNSVSYVDVAKKLNLTEGCVRTYISSLMKKGIPVEKVKLNNKTVVLHVSKEFMELNLKNELVAIYYDTAQPNQKKLGHF
ncbi:MAG: hypothetical protein PHO02_00470 [Candidatus Nanoarchaeia archaeon]|nr:hypothetical protein [Candidatus Nanoarchaeia archaeon]